MIIRKAEIKDIEKLREIYNYEINNGVATFDIGEKSYEDRLAWFNEHKNHYPMIVYEDEGEVMGFATLSQYRNRAAFNSTVEISVYVDVNHRKKGVASALMEAIIKKAKEDSEIHTVVAVITSENIVSIKLHEKFGFTYCGEIKEVGKKFGRYLGVTNMQLLV